MKSQHIKNYTIVKIIINSAKHVRMQQKLIQSLAEGILSHYVYLTKCNAFDSLSEYSLYDAMIRMVNHRKDLRIECESKVKSIRKPKGDYPRIDFIIKEAENPHQPKIAIELKFHKKTKQSLSLDLQNDINKLMAYQKEHAGHKISKYLMVLYKTNASGESTVKSDAELYFSTTSHCVNATYKMDVYKV